MFTLRSLGRYGACCARGLWKFSGLFTARKLSASGPSQLTKGIVRFELPATLRLCLKPQRCQKNIDLPIETGPVILYQRHAPDALLVGGDNRRHRSRV
jgi:hypothetical protein